MSLKLKKNGDVEFAQSKSNYSAPMKKPLTLKRERGGLLRIASESELEQGGQDEVDSEIAAVARRPTRARSTHAYQGRGISNKPPQGGALCSYDTIGGVQLPVLQAASDSPISVACSMTSFTAAS